MKNTVSSFLAFALALLFSRQVLAASVYVEPATGTGMTAPELESATELVRSAVPEVGYALNEKPANSDLVLKPKLIRLGKACVLTLSRIRKGAVEFSSSLKADQFEELDKVATRLTRSVLVGEKAVEHPRVGEITQKEAKEGAERRPTRPFTSIGLGGSKFSNLNSSGVGYSLGLAKGWDLNTAVIKLLAEGDFSGAAFFINGALNINYLFSTTDLAPYLGADFGLGVAKIDGGGVFSGQTRFGFVFGLDTGLIILRTAATNVDLGFRAAYLVNSNVIGTPGAYSLRLGLNF